MIVAGLRRTIRSAGGPSGVVAVAATGEWCVYLGVAQSTPPWNLETRSFFSGPEAQKELLTCDAGTLR